jgi:hypothetical protein
LRAAPVARITRVSGKQLRCAVGRHVVTTDRPVADGGGDAGCTSGELLLLSIGSCAAGSTRSALEARGVACMDLAVEIGFEPSPTGAARDLIVISVALPAAATAVDLPALEAAILDGGVVGRLRLGSELAVRFTQIGEEQA